MKHGVGVLILGLSTVAFGITFARAEGKGASEPLWAYGFLTPPSAVERFARQNPPVLRALRPDEDPVDQMRMRRVPGSSQTFSLVDIRDGQNVIDWFPGDHPPMPDVVKHGPAHFGRFKRGCASCHLANGKGRPENAQPAGLPVAYFIRQIHDFRTWLRHSADLRKPNTNTMILLAMAMTDEEVRQSAAYFAAIKWSSPWVKVIETSMVPKTSIDGNLFLALEQARTEPIAGRIIEVPEDTEQAELYRNPHSGFVAYVPVGSIKRGAELVENGGGGKTTKCTNCHGPDLMGDAEMPPLAGRSPSYMARQLYDFQQGTRGGSSALLMRPVVANLTEGDLVAITAYLASRPPVASRPAAPRPGLNLPVINTALR